MNCSVKKGGECTWKTQLVYWNCCDYTTMSFKQLLYTTAFTILLFYSVIQKREADKRMVGRLVGQPTPNVMMLVDGLRGRRVAKCQSLEEVIFLLRNFQQGQDNAFWLSCITQRH